MSTRSLRQVLSTMLTSDIGIGEWGFSALVEVIGRRTLFDTGARPDTVLTNAKELGVALISEKASLSPAASTRGN
jgi:metal-dependent hydrolase (beta-lactamase superfamily II)